MIDTPEILLGVGLLACLGMIIGCTFPLARYGATAVIDHLMAFSDEATARADPVVGQYFHGTSWDLSRCIPGLFVWNPVNDTTTTDAQGRTIVTHTPYDTLWRIVISLPAQDMTLTNHSACHLVTDREAAKAGQPNVIRAVLPLATLNQLRLQPVFADVGTAYPLGNARLKP